jgi:hypothetical protein
MPKILTQRTARSIGVFCLIPERTPAGENHQFERHRYALDDFVADGRAEGRRIAEIAAREVREPVAELAVAVRADERRRAIDRYREVRLVEAELAPELLDALRRCAEPGACDGRIARGDTEHREREERDAEKHRPEHEDALERVCAHVSGALS